MSAPAGLPPPRAALLGMLALGVVVAALRVAQRRDDPADFLLALGLVALFTPLRALMIRWLGGRRPYASAFAASLFSVVVGMAFREPLNLWPLLLRSTVFTAALETLPLFALRTSDRPGRLVLMAVYMSVVVHCLSGGFVLLSRDPLVGGLLMGAGVATMWSPLFLRRWLRSGERSR